MAIFNSKLLVYQRVPPNILNWAEVSSRKIGVPLAVLSYHGIIIYLSKRPDIETFKHGEVHQPHPSICSSGDLGSQPLARHTVQTSGWTTIPGG